MGEVSFTSGEVALVAALLAALSTPLGILFHALRGSYLDRIKEHQDRIKEHQDALVAANKRAEELRPALAELTSAVREQSRLIERLVEDRPRVR